MEGNWASGTDGSSLSNSSRLPTANAQFVVDSEKRVIVVKFGKKVVAADIAEYARQLLAHPSFQSDFSEIVDLSEVEELELEADEFIRLADEIDPFSDSAKRAFVVRSPVQKHAARMHKVLRNPRTIEIFDSVEEAERWIRHDGLQS